MGRNGDFSLFNDLFLFNSSIDRKSITKIKYCVIPQSVVSMEHVAQASDTLVQNK